MGKTSVWLSDELDARWRATGLPLSEVLRRGLDAIEGAPTALEAALRAALGTGYPFLPQARVFPAEPPPLPPPPEVAEEATVPVERAERCPHPKARVLKGKCWACGETVSKR